MRIRIAGGAATDNATSAKRYAACVSGAIRIERI
jgi:hypothetical protein